MEKITLEIEGLPQLVHIGSIYQYRIIVRNHETRPVTVVLKSNQNDAVYGVTVPASSNKDVEVTGEFENAGSQIVTYTIMKSGKVLDSKSQAVEVETTPAGVEKPLTRVKKAKSTSSSETWIAFLVLLIFAMVILIPIYWPQISGFFTGASSKEINTGRYGNYYLGIVKEPTGTDVDSYGNFTVLINNKDAQNPTYSGLVNFLLSDKTDQYPYQFVPRIMGGYTGSAESRVDLEYWNDIIDGTRQPNPPRTCVDFAEMLHNKAEMAGIRCAYVSIGLDNVSGIHALDAFETTDRGLIYIDDTNSSGPTKCVKTVNVQVGKEYIPQSLFPESGWHSTYESMGTVTDIFMTWDGSWKSRSGNSS